MKFLQCEVRRSPCQRSVRSVIGYLKEEGKLFIQFLVLTQLMYLLLQVEEKEQEVRNWYCLILQGSCRHNLTLGVQGSSFFFYWFPNKPDYILIQ